MPKWGGSQHPITDKGQSTSTKEDHVHHPEKAESNSTLMELQTGTQEGQEVGEYGEIARAYINIVYLKSIG